MLKFDLSILFNITGSNLSNHLVNCISSNAAT